MKSRGILKNPITKTLFFIFILVYFLIIIYCYVFPNDFEPSLFLFFGFGLILIVSFYFFSSINFPSRDLKIKVFDENIIKMILIFLLITCFFISPISFSEVIIDWGQISILNYVRTIISLIGIIFVPGACIFDLVFPRSTIAKRLNVEPFLVKITIYPLISLTYLGCVTLILDHFNLTRYFIDIFLFSSILFVFVLDLLVQKKRGGKLERNIKTIEVSKNTLLTLLIGFAITIIAFGILISSQYLIPGDRWRSDSSAIVIGTSENGIFYSGAKNYAKYWSCIIFALSRFCGIPYINVNVILFLLLYLSSTTSYLLSKALLSHMKEEYSVLSSIFITLLFNTTMLVVQFSYHTFAFLLLFISLAFFFLLTKSNYLIENHKLNTEDFIIVIFSSFFLFQSLMTYFIPALIGTIIIFIHCLFVSNLKYALRNYLIFYLGLILFFLIFDLFTFNFFSWVSIRSVGDFLGTPLFIEADTYPLRRFLTSFLVYPLLLIPLLFIFIIIIFSNSISSILKKLKLKLHIISKKSRVSFISKNISLLFLFSVLTVLTLLLIDLDPSFRLNFLFNQYISTDPELFNTNYFFPLFYLVFLFGTLGIFGVFGSVLSYFCYKERKNLFFFLLTWIVIIIGISSSLLFLRWIQYPSFIVSNIPSDFIDMMIYWFARTWYYLMIPLSLFASIGLIKIFNVQFKKKTHNKFNLKSYKNIKKSISLFFVFFLFVLFFTNSITTSIYWDNYTQRITDEEAQIIGWITKNIEKDSRILHHPYSSSFRRLEKDLYLHNVYWLTAEIANALSNYEEQDEDIYKWQPITNNYGEISLLYEEDGRKNVIKVHDTSISGNISMMNEFESPVTNGSFSFWLKTDTANESTDAGLSLTTFGDTTEANLNLYINYGNLYYFNDSVLVELNSTYEANQWNYYKVNFNCNLSYWNISMNGNLLNESISGNFNLPFTGDLSNCSKIEISTSLLGEDYQTYFDLFNFSWAPISDNNDVYDRVLNDIAKLIPYLRLENIHYFIMNKDYREDLQELIDYFYRIELYQYENFMIYQSIAI
ncbi:MAG: hypothetical protein EU535_05765 [Promethearchaeota archaeon]|nr:MAG: hypothetical protein EU535_05765 [Candidatus Lokiarchaeota archaeon]